MPTPPTPPTARQAILAAAGVCILAIIGAIVWAGFTATPVRMINGAGATFPYPIYLLWARQYHQATSPNGVQVNYQAIGSGGGIRQIEAGTVDFGASDAPLTASELKKHDLVQWPMVMGGVAVVVKLPGIAPGRFKLTGHILAQIYLGKITRWNDPDIAAINPKLTLPDLPITVVHRSDGSGTTWIFTSYLSKVSPIWKQHIGQAKAVPWPIGIGGKGNPGVARYLDRIQGAIGYIEFAYVKQKGLTYIKLRNRAGRFVAPSVETFQAAAANAHWAHAPGLYMVLTDEPGEESWPICGATFILMPTRPPDPAAARRALAFFNFCYTHGDQMAERLDYVAMPENVVDIVKKLWAEKFRADGKPLLKN